MREERWREREERAWDRNPEEMKIQAKVKGKEEMNESPSSSSFSPSSSFSTFRILLHPSSVFSFPSSSFFPLSSSLMEREKKQERRKREREGREREGIKGKGRISSLLISCRVSSNSCLCSSCFFSHSFSFSLTSFLFLFSSLPRLRFLRLLKS